MSKKDKELKKAFKETKKIIKKYNKNRKIALKKSRFKEFIRKILTRKCNRGKKANLIILDELHSYKESEMYNNIIALTPEEHHRTNNNEIKYLYRAEYMQNPFEILTEENLERLEKHCKKAIHYERGEIKKEHEVTLCLLYRYQEQQEQIKKQNRIIDLMATYIKSLTVDLKIPTGENAFWDIEEIKKYFERNEIKNELYRGK